RTHKRRVDAFQRNCWRLVEEELEQGAFDGFELAHFSRLVTSICKHFKNIIYQIQPHAGEWNIAPHNRWVMREMLAKTEEFKNLRESDNASPRTLQLAKNFSLVSQPKTWANKIKELGTDSKKLKVFVSSDSDLAGVFTNAARFRANPAQNPQVCVLASFKDESEDKYSSWGHWVTVLIKRNEKTGKNDVTYMESSRWFGDDEMGETAQGQRENLEALMYLLNEAPLP
ncbi:hypothetical protein KAU11_03575, partial [Candidatus Babeliales bacterium]|nr:hypothetical protein [Candidatus Babeliales bacterium]